MFSLGDTVVSKVQYGGHSYHYKFGKVVQKTQTGKFRVQLLREKCEQWDLQKLYSTRKIIPTDEVVVDPASGAEVTQLADAQGRTSKRFFYGWSLYDPDTEYVDYSGVGG